MTSSTSMSPPQKQTCRRSHNLRARSPHVPAYVKGHLHLGYGGDVPPENITITEYYDLTTLKKSNLRRSDELIPRPSEVDVTEKVIKVPVPREHPYASHIPRCAVFPFSRFSDDANSSAVIVPKKTKGAPYRHEVLQKPVKAGPWPGQNNFYDYPRQMKGVGQVLYPSPPKTLCPNSALSARDTALSTQNAHMLRDWEKKQYLSSYQRDYPGRELMNILDEKTAGMITQEGVPYPEQQSPYLAFRRAPGCPPSGSGLLELQDSNSKSDTLRQFHRSTSDATVDLRDNSRTGKRYQFYGLGSHYFRNRTAVPLPVA